MNGNYVNRGNNDNSVYASNIGNLGNNPNPVVFSNFGNNVNLGSSDNNVNNAINGNTYQYSYIY